uniref:Uncharacterized protein n=1 Tax=Romanomermis culicivorax TaxID=13658 RepID=A0A915JV08_ROMCU
MVEPSLHSDRQLASQNAAKILQSVGSVRLGRLPTIQWAVLSPLSPNYFVDQTDRVIQLVDDFRGADAGSLFLAKWVHNRSDRNTNHDENLHTYNDERLEDAELCKNYTDDYGYLK